VYNPTTKKPGLVPFHTQHSLLMLALLFTIFLAFCFLLVQNYRLHNSTEQKILQNRFRERVKSIDGLLGNIRSQVRTLQLSAEADLTDRALHPGQASPPAFGALRDNTEGDYFHLDNYRPPLTEKMLGNLTGSGSIQRRSPDFYRELHMALNLNPRFRAIAENFTELSWVYYLSKNDFINIYPWAPATELRNSPQLKEHEFYRLSLPTPNPERQTFWTRAYLDEYGKGLTTTCSAPVYDGQHFLGTVAIDLTIEFLSSLMRDFDTENGSLLLINSDRQLLAHPTLISTANATISTLQDALPGDLQKTTAHLESLPALQLTQLGSWSVLQAPLQNAPWQVIFFRQHPSQTKAFVAQLGGGTLTALLVLLGMICTMAFLNHRHIVWPSEQMLHFIDALNRRKTPFIDARIPTMWRPWFENIEKIFRDNQALAEENRQDMVVLDQRIKERTIELELLNQAFREEIEERSKAEGALRVVNQKLQELSLVDGLTGIPNYRKFNEYLNFCWKQMLREQSPVSIIMCDVDHFKQYSAAYGHQAGDRCLQEIAHAIQTSLQRPTDLVARYGGEEFIILLPGTDHPGAKRVATSIQQTIAALEIPHSGSLADSCVRFSIGMATAVPSHGGSPESLLEAADQSLYRAKETGRSRVIALPVKC
jgi:diguanylate cyclase (GGDEF)-like protein